MTARARCLDALAVPGVLTDADAREWRADAGSRRLVAMLRDSKQSCEMRLVGEAALGDDLIQRPIGRRHERPFDHSNQRRAVASPVEHVD